jgi:starch phosphorylase
VAGHRARRRHRPTWLGTPLSSLLADKGVLEGDGEGALHVKHREESAISDAVLAIDDDAWVSARKAQKRMLAQEVHRRLHEMRTRQGTPPSAPPPFVIEEDALVIGFARRFATYKRANLILSDRERLLRILKENGRVQLVFAGKAHPADKPGQALIQELHKLSWDPDFGGHIVVLEGYDMVLGKRMTAGSDVWLNNPRRPLEASGTSGMKAAMNGVPNLSILDGWWDEGFADDNGWAIGDRETREDYQDADALYETLEDQVKTEFADPSAFARRQKRSTASSLWQFSTARMVTEYDSRMYRS